MKYYTQQKLFSKLSFITAPIQGAKTSAILVIVKTGSRYENKDNNGISHFLEHMFFKGTVKRGSTFILSSELDSLGGEYNAFTAKEYTGYWIKVAKNKAHRAVDILGDMLLNSKFDEQEIEREKGVIIEELNMYQDNPMMHIEDVLESCLYGDTPAGWDTIGTKSNISKFKKEDFVNYFNQQYGTKSMVVVVSGAIDDKLKDKVNNIFSKALDNKWQRKIKIIEQQKKAQLKIEWKDNDQINLSLGVRTSAIDSKSEFKIKLLAMILGGIMSSRLFIRLRERNGLAYYVRTNAEFYSDTGYLTTQAGVTNDKVVKAIRIILEEYKRLTKELVGLKELKKIKDSLSGRLSLQLETPDSLANWYGHQAILRKKILTPNEFLKDIKNISPEDLKKVAQKIFVNKGLNLAIIGKVKESQFKNILHF